MTTGRIEAFSDGVIAILATIMVLELKVPHGADWHALQPLVSVFLAYVLSFTYLGIYWSNHHHMFHMCDRVTGKILWANLHLLFWLSLIPVATAWTGDNHTAPLPTALYGVILLFSGIAYMILQAAIISEQGSRSKLAAAVGGDYKGKVSAVIYLFSIPAAFVRPWISQLLFLLVAVMWFVPDPRIERKITEAA
jgi:uncharacterized membrane protein